MTPLEIQEKSSQYAPSVKAAGHILGFKEKRIYQFFKRFFDILFSLLSLSLCGWLMILIGLIVKCQDGGPIFYISYRVSKNGSIFRMYKFRTMVVGADAQLDSLTGEIDALVAVEVFPQRVAQTARDESVEREPVVVRADPQAHPRDAHERR